MISTLRQFSFGDTREDGFIFTSYSKKTTKDGSIRERENWYSPAAFHRQQILKCLCNSRRRAETQGLPFDLDTEYLLSIYPEDGMCPVFGFQMEWCGDKNTSPSLDKIVPSKGYVRDNVVWVSQYANMLKTANSLETLRALLTFYERLEGQNEGQRTH